MAENKAICPDCGQTITVSGQIMVGWLVDCPNCDAELEIVETVPLELDFFYGDDESDDYEDDEDEDNDDL
jgi:lysine biosynthesis protein LysW